MRHQRIGVAVSHAMFAFEPCNQLHVLEAWFDNQVRTTLDSARRGVAPVGVVL
jgi:hypothetical protein